MKGEGTTVVERKRCRADDSELKRKKREAQYWSQRASSTLEGPSCSTGERKGPAEIYEKEASRRDGRSEKDVGGKGARLEVERNKSAGPYAGREQRERTSVTPHPSQHCKSHL